MFKKLTALLLAIVMLATVAIGCGNTDPAETSQSTTTTQATSATEASETTAASQTNKYEIGDNLPDDLNYNGAEVHFISRGRDWCKDTIDVEALNGEIINDAVYNRNAAVEDRLGIQIIDHKDDGSGDYVILDMMRTQIPAGSCDYDVVCSATYTLLEGITGNLWQNILQVEEIDLSRPYWSQAINEAMRVGNGQYIVTGAISMAYYRFIFATFFNKGLFDEFQVPYLYENVRNGNWTIDYQREIATTFYADLNGSNTADEADRFGFVLNHNNIGVSAYWAAFELPILSKDADNLLTLNVNKDRTIAAVEKINSLVWNEKAAWRIACYGLDDEQADLVKFLAEDRAAMTTLRLIEVETATMRDMESAYGIVPMPKFDQAQTEYHSLIHDNSDGFAIPLTTTGEKLSMVGALMEAMASEGYRTLEPAYYEVALTSKYVSDTESVEMLDMVINSLHVDPGFLFVDATAGFHQNMATWVSNNANNVASSMASIDRVAKKKLEQLNKAILDIQ